MSFNFKDIEIKKFLNKKVIISTIAIVLVVTTAAIGITIKKSKSNKDSQTKVKYTILNKTNVMTTVSSSGAIKSGTSTNVYSNFDDNYTLKEVNVEVGDEVKAGDVLAVIDTSDFEKEIEQLEATVTANETKAKLTLEKAKKAYEDEKNLYDNDLNSSVVNANATLESAKLSLENAQRVYEYNKMLNENGDISENDLKSKEIDFENAKNDYTKAEVALKSAKVSAEQSLKNAQTDYESALASYNDNSDRLQLETKKAKLEDSKVIAPVDGTITAVNVAVGDKCGSGAFFVIQDLKDLIVDVDVDETEIANVKVGQKAQVTTDASENQILNGEIVSVDPISSAVASTSSSSSSSSGSSSSGSGTSNSTSSDVTFTAKVQINDYNELVKVGMNAVVNIITNEVNDVYAVPYEAIKNENGQSVVYAAKEKSGKYVVESIPITTGLESDIYTEVSGTNLSDGLIILNAPSSYKVGDEVDIKLPQKPLQANKEGNSQDVTNITEPKKDGEE